MPATMKTPSTKGFLAKISTPVTAETTTPGGTQVTAARRPTTAGSTASSETAKKHN